MLTPAWRCSVQAALLGWALAQLHALEPRCHRRPCPLPSTPYARGIPVPPTPSSPSPPIHETDLRLQTSSSYLVPALAPLLPGLLRAVCLRRRQRVGRGAHAVPQAGVSAGTSSWLLVTAAVSTVC